MAVKLGNGNWAVKEDKLLAYNDNSGLFFNKEFDFSRGTSATYVAKDGLIASAASDTPRIDFTNDTKGHLLLEPSRTNLFQYSQAFSTWQKINNIVITDNFTTSPDGTQNSSKLTFDGTTNGRVEKPVTTTIGNEYTFSVWLKNDNLADTTQVWLGNSQFVQGEYVTITNEWQRFTTTQTADGTTEYPRINVNQVGSIFAWGAQFEEGYPTSYIPTTGATSTRNADVCNNSSSAQDFNDSEGVLYAEIASLANDGTFRQLTISDSSTSDRVSIDFTSTDNQIRSFSSSGGSTAANMTRTITDSKQFNKVAVKYKLNDYALYINGEQVATDTSAAAPVGLQELAFDNGGSSNDFYGKVRNLQVFTEALTDEQLQKLTS